MMEKIEFIVEIEFIGGGSSPPPPPPPPPPDEYTTLKAAALAAAAANNAALWFLGKPADLVGNVYTDSAGTTQAGIGDIIGLLKDRNGNVFPATQNASGFEPTIVQVGDYCLMAFGGAHVLVEDFHPNADSDHTIIAAAMNVAGGVQCVISCSPDDYWRMPALGFYDPGMDGAGMLYSQNIDASNGSTTFSAVTNYPLTLPPVISVKKSATALTLYANGAVAGAETLVASSSAMTAGMIGSRYNAFFDPFTGQIALVCAAAVAMSDADRQAIERFGALLTGVTYP